MSNKFGVKSPYKTANFNANCNRIREARERGLGENAIAGVFQDEGMSVEACDLPSERCFEELSKKPAKKANFGKQCEEALRLKKKIESDDEKDEAQQKFHESEDNESLTA